jgi:multisubunit Na+/H+ antiporter MnhB subunit
MKLSGRTPWWALPLLWLALGLVMLAAFWIGGRPGDGFRSFAVMAGIATLLVLGARSETVRLIRQPDERWASIDLRATSMSGLVILLVLIGAWLYELAHGRDGSPYGQIMAIGGLSYLVALLFLRWRS